MLIPRYWSRAESEAVTPDGRTVRFQLWRGARGSIAEAQAAAEQAVARVAERIRSGAGFPEKYSYGDRPLREEVVREIVGAGTPDDPDAAITRNTYGALVLNAARAFFIDVDVEGAEPGGAARSSSESQPGGQPQTPGQAVEAVAQQVFNVVDSLPLPSGLKSFLGAFRPSAPSGSAPAPTPAAPAEPPPPPPSSDPASASIERLRRFVATKPEWRVRVYRTAAGLRYLVTHATFSPTDAEVRSTLAALGADPQYIRLCQVQKSFRARLTPKPWRIGVRNPPVGFPYEGPAEEQEMREWVARYDSASAGRATCRFVEEIGGGVEHPDIAPIRALHDEQTKAASGLPLA
ncbi:MAG TPA: hypothetical protein VF092_21280 [Longimicrobium sp.]